MNLIVLVSGVVVVGALVGLWVLSLGQWHWQGKKRKFGPPAAPRVEPVERITRPEVPGAKARVLALRRRPTSVVSVFSPLPRLDPLPDIAAPLGAEEEPIAAVASSEGDEEPESGSDGGV